MIICGDWKCVTYVTKLKLIDECCLRCDIFYTAQGGGGDIEDIDFENQYNIHERLFFFIKSTKISTRFCGDGI